MSDAQSHAEAKRPSSRNISVLRALAPFLKPYTLTAALALSALVLTAAVSLALPLAARSVVDGFAAGDFSQLNRYFLGALGLAALFASGTALRYWMVTRLGERVIADIRIAVFDRMLSISPAFFDRLLTGEVLSRITTDTTLLLTVVSSSASWFLRNIIVLSGGLVLMLWTTPKLTGLVLLIVPLLMLPIILLGRRLRTLSRENQDWIAASSGNASEALLSIQTVQAFTHEGESQATFSDVTERSFTSARQRITVRAQLTAIVIFVVFAGILGVLWMGARDVAAGAMSAGELVQFLFFAGMVAGAVAALSELWTELQRAAGATERLIELLQAEDSIQDPTSPVHLPEPVKGAIELENVTFAYETRPEAPALHDISVSIAPGETVALVGPSGAGKSTLIQLLLRFYEPQSGQIMLDGINLAAMARSEFRRALSLVPQDPVIFAASARDNIRFGRPQASDEEVGLAARAAAAHDFITALPDGYDTYVGERGVMLSGGQRQRIAIARAILRDAPILLLDEATSALDAQSERAVQEAVDRLARDRTTLVIAHRLATVKKADRILVLDQGRIVAEGTHDGLVASGGLYARLARLQFTDGTPSS
ncbi:ABC transporter transmembrane domain-containing protein [Maricaulaceae bacterium EIL42A08]|nr:ABC transporter transmembrane domain-containing protein [Maricaulaceae bacterium EIL42A08]